MSWIAAGVTIGSALLGSHSSKRAAQVQQDASAAAVAEQRRQYDLTRTDQMPWLEAGRNALARLSDPNGFTASQDYAFRRSEGNRGVQNTFAARGAGQSGNALKALDEFNSNLASGEFGNWFNREAGIAGVGQNTATNLGVVGQNTGARVGNALIAGGDARASGIMDSAAILAGGANDVASNWLYRNGGRRRAPAYPTNIG